jgi:hypothetical protein
LKAIGRLILLSVELSYFVKAELLNCVNCNPVPRGTRNHLLETLWTAGSLRLTRGIQLDLGDRAKRCLSKDPAPAAYQARAEDKVKLSDDVIEEAFRWSATARRALFHALRPAF